MTGVTVHKYGATARYYGATAHYYGATARYYGATAHYCRTTAQKTTASVSLFLWEPQTSNLNKHVARTLNQAETFSQQVLLTL